MTQPEGFLDPEKPDWVCEIIPSLYGLKQSPRQWNKKLHEFLEGIQLTQSLNDPSMYFIKEKGNLQGLIVTHVDDIAVTGTNEFIKSFLTKLKNKFEISKDENITQFLSLQLKHKSITTVSLSQYH